MIDLDIVTEFNLYNIIFAKDTLQLDDEKTVVLVNLLFAVLNDIRQLSGAGEGGLENSFVVTSGRVLDIDSKIAYKESYLRCSPSSHSIIIFH